MAEPERRDSKLLLAVRNPLGIIALFVSLIEAVTATAASASPYLVTGQRWALVIFAVAFPPIVLGVFYWLVTRHANKLYAPGDWRDERNLFGPQTEQVRNERDEERLELLAVQPPVVQPGAPLATPAAAPKPLPPVKPELALAREAEDLVFRLLRYEMRGEILRDITTLGFGPNFALDGAIVGGGRFLGVEVKVLRSPQALDRALSMSSSIKALSDALRGRKTTLELLVVLVTIDADADARAELLKAASARLSQLPFPVSVRVHDLQELRAQYGR